MASSASEFELASEAGVGEDQPNPGALIQQAAEPYNNAAEAQLKANIESFLLSLPLGEVPVPFTLRSVLCFHTCANPDANHGRVCMQVSKHKA